MKMGVCGQFPIYHLPALCFSSTSNWPYLSSPSQVPQGSLKSGKEKGEEEKKGKRKVLFHRFLWSDVGSLCLWWLSEADPFSWCGWSFYRFLRHTCKPTMVSVEWGLAPDAATSLPCCWTDGFSHNLLSLNVLVVDQTPEYVCQVLQEVLPKLLSLGLKWEKRISPPPPSCQSPMGMREIPKRFNR